jgi:DNA adenine methylase
MEVIMKFKTKYGIVRFNNNNNEIIGSPLPHYGSKGYMLPKLKEYFPKHINKFVEPFGGGCSVSPNIICNKAVYNDINPEVYGFFNYLKTNDRITDILSYLDDRIIKFKLNNDKDAFNRFYDNYNSTKYSERHPLDFYLLVCHSLDDSITLINHQSNIGFSECVFNDNLRKDLTVFHERIHNIDISFFNNDIFTNKFNVDINVEHGDYVYCDPPYSLTMDSWIMDRDDKKLSVILDDYNDRGVYWGMTNYLTYGVEDNTVLKKWVEDNDYKVHSTNPEYNILNKNNPHDEVFITNYI